MFGMKAEIALREKALDFELVMVPFDMDRLYEPKHAEVVRINPKQQVPVLTHEGVEIFDSTQIFEYVEELKPEPPLWPRERAARAEARLMELKSDEVFFPPIIRLMGLQEAPQDPAAVAARAAASAFYDDLEERIGARAFLAGDYSYADIAFCMAQVFAHRMGAPMAEHPRLRAWRERVGAREAVAAVLRRLVAFLISHKRPIPDFMARFAP
jgi:glutathione S-transferase